ncbi:MAG: ABC transporter permease [Anaerolineae bacterium]|nr:MAG: ABC transporter permease [Anaerolineae bacterium]
MTRQALVKLVWVQIKLFLREPVAFFFTLAFPPMLLLLFGAAFGNEIDPAYNTEYGFIDYYTPALMALIAGTVGLMSVPVKTASERETGVLKRFQATPLKAETVMMADLLTHLGINLLSALFTTLTGYLVYDLALPQRPMAVLGAVVLGALGFAGFGYLLAALLPTARAAQIAGSALFFPMMFLSGASIPLEMLPSWLQRVAEVLPMTRMVHLVTGLWLWPESQGLVRDALLLAVMAVIGLVAAGRLFRWSG